MNDYPWLRPADARLRLRYQQQQLHHGVLLHGPAGLGKQALVRDLAAMLLCRQPTSTGACGGCHGCQLHQAGHHPDYYQARAAESRIITVDRIRQISRQMAERSQLGGNKVVVVQPADAMNTAAANALLKTLEEPAADSYLLLSTEQIRRLPATIVSRCHAVRICPPPEHLALGWLREQLPEATDLRAALRINQGAPLSTLAYCRDGGERHRLALVSAMAAPESLDKLALAQSYMSRPQLSALILDHLLLDAVKYHQGVAPDNWSHCDQLRAVRAFAIRFTPLQLFEGQKSLVAMAELIAANAGINGELQVFDWLAGLWGDISSRA